MVFALGDPVPRIGRRGGAVREATRLAADIKRLVVEDNTAAIDGGGIAAAGKLRLIMTTVRDNAAALGGGLAISPGSTVRSSTFDGNVATGLAAFTGHDILAQGRGTVTILNSTITGQIQTIAFFIPGTTGRVDGTDVVLGNVTVNEVSVSSLGGDVGSFTLRNTIVEQCDAALLSQGYNLVVEEGCAISGDLTGIVVGQDPLPGVLGDNGGPTQTRAPVAVSEAVDGGNPDEPGSDGAACEPTDQRGLMRPLGGRCDIGAVEAE